LYQAAAFQSVGRQLCFQRRDFWPFAEVLEAVLCEMLLRYPEDLPYKNGMTFSLETDLELIRAPRERTWPLQMLSRQRRESRYLLFQPQAVRSPGSKIDCCSADSTIGAKITILLEQLKAAYGKSYTVRPVDIFRGEHKEEWFKELNPNSKIPVLIDHENDNLVIMEGQAILQYLVKKFDPGMSLSLVLPHHEGLTCDEDFKFSFNDERLQCECEQWIGFAQAHILPYMGEAV
jgi:hypothetical protein